MDNNRKFQSISETAQHILVDDPAYAAMFTTTPKTNTESTMDLRNTDSWKPGFSVR